MMKEAKLALANKEFFPELQQCDKLASTSCFYIKKIVSKSKNASLRR